MKYVALLLAFAQPVAAVGPGSSGDHAPVYYLSLGDSLAAGVQPIGDPTDLYRTDEGYADQLYAIATSWYPNLELVKLGCPGETTGTMIDGGICAYDHGSQLDQAVANARRSLELRLFEDARNEAAFALELDNNNKEARDILRRCN